MKRKIALLTMAAMLAASLAGCGADSAPAAQKNESQSNEAASEPKTQAEKQDEEPYVCRIVSVGDATTEACEAVAAKASEITMEKFNTKIELVRYGYGTFVNEVNLILSSGEKLDLFPSFGYGVANAASTGQILDITDLLDQYGQGIKESVTEGEWGCVTVNGGIYAVPNNKEKAQGFGIAMRKDMLDEVDFDLSTIKTEADLEPLFVAIKEKFPETYPLVSDNGGMGYHMIERDDLGGDYGVIMNSTQTDEAKVVNYFETPEYKEVVKLHYDWAQKGLILPDAANNTESAGTLIGAGKGFAYYTNTKPGIEAEWERKTGTEMVVLELVPPFKTTSGVANLWFVAHQSENPEKAMQVLNEIYTNPELSNLFINGIEGEHYVRDEEAGVIKYPEGMNAANTPYISIAWVWPNELNTMPWDTDGATIWQDTIAFNESATESIALGFMWDSANVLNEITACNNVKAKYENALNCGMMNPDEALDRLNEELRTAGLDVILEEKQKQLDAWMAANK